MKALPSILLALASLLVLPAAHADIVAGINKVRARGCEGKRGVPTPLKKNASLGLIGMFVGPVLLAVGFGLLAEFPARYRSAGSD